MDHDRNLAKWCLFFGLVPLDKPFRARHWLRTDSPPLFDGEVYEGLDLIGQIPNPRLVWIVRIELLGSFISQSRLGTGVDVSKDGLKTTILVFHVGLAWHELLVDLDEVRLVFSNAVRDGMLDELVKGLDLLVHDTILLEEGVDDLPLVLHINLVLASGFDLILGVQLATLLTSDRRLLAVFGLESLRIKHIVNWL